MVVELLIVGACIAASSSVHAEDESVAILRFVSFGKVLEFHGFSLESYMSLLNHRHVLLACLLLVASPEIGNIFVLQHWRDRS